MAGDFSKEVIPEQSLEEPVNPVKVWVCPGRRCQACKGMEGRRTGVFDPWPRELLQAGSAAEKKKKKKKKGFICLYNLNWFSKPPVN